MTSPGLPSQISVTPVEGRVHVLFDDAEIVSSTKALAVERPGEAVQFYIPLEDIRSDLLLDSDTKVTSPHLGEANYFHLRSATATAEDAAWYYPDPHPDAAAIRNHVAFAGPRIRHERTPV